MLIQETHFRSKDTQTESERLKKRHFMQIEMTKKQGQKNSYQNKIDCKVKAITKNKEGIIQR